MPNKNATINVKDKAQIELFVQSRSASMFNYVQKSKSNFSMWYKTLTHSDLTNRGKRNGLNEGLDKNYLYYLSVEEMENIQKLSPNKNFESAKQSNIGLPIKFYEDLEIPRLERREGKQLEQHKHVRLNDYVDVFLVNDTLKYFTQDYTRTVLEKLNKNFSKFCDENNISLNEDDEFTEIQLTEAIHGLGTADDKQFHKLRLSMFLNDTVIFLIEHNKDRKNLFIMLEKNPRFFTLVGESDTAWENYITSQRNQEISAIKGSAPLVASVDQKSRRLQSAWKEKLAKEMMSYTTEEGKVFCPITGISADFHSFSMLFVASHIKRHCDCKNDKESFDINNGLLLSANADALFDKYMISISETKQLMFSFLLENEKILCNQLLLNLPIFQYVLNEERMKNLEKHRNIFLQKEEERKKSFV